MDITRLNLAKVADDYLEYIRANESISLENLAEFVNIASRIILIKSQNILPSLEITPRKKKKSSILKTSSENTRNSKPQEKKLEKCWRKKDFSFSRDYLLGVAAAYLRSKKRECF